MGLKSTFANAAAVAFKAADDIPVDVILRRTVAGTYNPATGTTTPSTTTDYPASAIMGTYKQFELSGTSILATDRRATIQQSQVSAMGTVTTSDKLIVGGTTRTIVNVGQDCAGVLWVLQVRG